MLALTDEDDWVFDPFLGTGTAIIAAIRHNRRGAGAEIIPKYVSLAKQRIEQAINGTLKTRPMNKPVYDPVKAGNLQSSSPWSKTKGEEQMSIFDSPKSGERYKKS